MVPRADRATTAPREGDEAIEIRGRKIDLPSRAEMELRAGALLVRERVDRPPVPVEDVARSVGIDTISIAPLERQSAVLMGAPGELLGIVLNQNEGPLRHRFSIAHEIGHRVLHPDLQLHSFLAPVAARGDTYAKIERLCDFFAGCLLMPQDMVFAAVRTGKSLKQLGDLFSVSKIAMRVRLGELRIPVPEEGGKR